MQSDTSTTYQALSQLGLGGLCLCCARFCRLQSDTQLRHIINVHRITFCS